MVVQLLLALVAVLPRVAPEGLLVAGAALGLLDVGAVAHRDCRRGEDVLVVLQVAVRVPSVVVVRLDERVHAKAVEALVARPLALGSLEMSGPQVVRRRTPHHCRSRPQAAGLADGPDKGPQSCQTAGYDGQALFGTGPYGDVESRPCRISVRGISQRSRT